MYFVFNNLNEDNKNDEINDLIEVIECYNLD